MADPGRVLGFHIISPTSAGPWPADAIASLIATAIGDPVDLSTDIRPGWTKLIVHITRDQFTTHGAAAIERLFESLCDTAGAHFARSFAADEWALVEDGELAGVFDALDWLQYFGPRFGANSPASRASRLATARETNRGARVVTIAVDPLGGSWVTRQDAARELHIELRPLPASARHEVDPALRLQQALPPEPVKWQPQQRRAMFDARVHTIREIEAGMADVRLFDLFRQTYLPGKLDEPLLDRMATWLPHYGADRAAGAFRGVARLHERHRGAAPLDPVALEGCVKLVSWGGDELALATRELLMEHIVSLADPTTARFARHAYDPHVVQGMLKLTSALIRQCPCPRCQAMRG